MSYNIRFLNKEDKINNWNFRRDNVAGLIMSYHPDLFGVQEAKSKQIKDLETRLPEFGWYGVGRNNGKKRGEFSAIFYRKSRFDLLDTGSFWFSRKPSRAGSKGWDAALPRVASWCKLKDKNTGVVFYHFNTHYDHRGKVAREKSSELLAQKIKEIAGNSAVVLTGDFNSLPSSKPYEILVANTGLFDAQLVSKTPHQGPAGSISGFFVREQITRKIDYIFVSKFFKVLQHAILTDHKEGRYFSDHLPLLAEIEINNEVL
ncbi:endonuclease/exonuclease/phosphatase family protein [Adhaeribacter aquaticus]|uniref:endonuclease/exonuclease/phosphatase family protein n=1 Tax=Adhaeribacter aquaticus TaxID=299567 RepID=UPI000402968B|nr:endonuclease/exonuclease/phosphatase family protein [Adhaeribacter aquaticus]